MVTLEQIKQWFRTGLRPTQQQFYDTFDSFVHKGEKISIGDIEGMEDTIAELRRLIEACCPSTTKPGGNGVSGSGMDGGSGGGMDEGGIGYDYISGAVFDVLDFTNTNISSLDELMNIVPPGSAFDPLFLEKKITVYQGGVVYPHLDFLFALYNIKIYIQGVETLWSELSNIDISLIEEFRIYSIASYRGYIALKRAIK